MEAWWNKLKVDVFSREELFEGCGTLVVEPLKLWTVAAGDKASVDGFVGLKDAGSGARSHRFNEDGVRVVVV